jgi:hypothetical protein
MSTSAATFLTYTATDQYYSSTTLRVRPEAIVAFYESMSMANHVTLQLACGHMWNIDSTMTDVARDLGTTP